MTETSTVRALLDLEDSGAEVLLERAPGSSAYLWPLARWPIAGALASAHLKVTAHTQLGLRTNRLYYLKRMLREALPNPRSSDRLSANAEHLFFVSGVTRTSAPRGVGNWLCDGFAEALGNRAVVIQQAGFDLLTPRSQRPANPRTRTWAPAAARIRDAAQAAPPSGADRDQVIRFLDDIYTRLGELLPEEAHGRITDEVLGWVGRLRPADAEFNALLDRARPRRIYMEDASYGHLSDSIRIAHERGIEVAELQHGWIGASHAAYNYGRAWFDSPLTSSLPDTLLTFGEYWGERLRFPGRIVPVGKPILERAAISAALYAERPNRLLLVSSVYEQERLLEAAAKLRRLLPTNWEIALRPHPTERADAETLFADALAHGVVIDRVLDVNASISSSRAVAGLVSTVLYEALPLGVHIGIIETDLAEFYTDAEVFPRRLEDDASFAEFAKTLLSGSAPDPESARSIWQADAVETFLRSCATS